ncbi:MAG: hypothetical protein IPK82_27340 [Polyangiaceae bacterium]|nr:hypothetical protein [Polyangiaceae bacterium]
MSVMRWKVTALSALSAIAHANAATAGAFEVVGADPVGVAEASARVARASDGAAAFYNPAGLAMGRGVGILVAPLLMGSTLQIQGKTSSISDPFGFCITAHGTVPLKSFLEDRIRVGIAMFVPPEAAIHLLVAQPTAPQLPYFDNRTQRLMVEPAFAVRITDAFSVGAGVNVLGGVKGPADVRPGASGAPEPRLSIDATTQIAAQVGVRFDLTERVHLGAAYRQEFKVPVFVATQAQVGGIELSADVDLEHAMFDPHTIVVGAAFELGRFDVEIDASYSMWSLYQGPVLGVRAELPGALLTSEERRSLFRDVATLRVGGGYGIDVGRRSELVFHAGTGVEPSILRSTRQGTTNFADGTKVFGGLGASLSLRDVLPKTLRFSLGLGLTAMLDKTIEKVACSRAPCPPDTVSGPDAKNPSVGIDNAGYPTLKSGGALLTGTLGVGVDL